MKPFLIVGIGNPLVSDDGIGPQLVTSIQPLLDESLFDFKTEYTCHLEMLDRIKGYQSLFILDSSYLKSRGPGYISFYSVENYHNTGHLDNYHDISFREMIELANTLQLDVPKQIYIIAIEIVEDKIFSNALSEPLQAVYQTLIENTSTYINQITEQVLIQQNNEIIQ